MLFEVFAIFRTRFSDKILVSNGERPNAKIETKMRSWGPKSAAIQHGIQLLTHVAQTQLLFAKWNVATVLAWKACGCRIVTSEVASYVLDGPVTRQFKQTLP